MPMGEKGERRQFGPVTDADFPHLKKLKIKKKDSL
jgi:hypothetical protein